MLCVMISFLTEGKLSSCDMLIVLGTFFFVVCLACFCLASWCLSVNTACSAPCMKVCWSAGTSTQHFCDCNNKVIKWPNMLLFTLTVYAFSQSEDCKRQLQYSSAKTKGNMALVLTSINIFYNFAVICVVIGLTARYINPPCDCWCPCYGKNTIALCMWAYNHALVPDTIPQSMELYCWISFQLTLIAGLRAYCVWQIREHHCYSRLDWPLKPCVCISELTCMVCLLCILHIHTIAVMYIKSWSVYMG